LNDGEKGLAPEGNWIPPLDPGSGKFGTPCDRMQIAKARKLPLLFDALALVELLEEPHAVSAAAQRTVPAATRVRKRGIHITPRVVRAPG
jgi:hypothetical protein